MVHPAVVVPVQVLTAQPRLKTAMQTMVEMVVFNLTHHEWDTQAVSVLQVDSQVCRGKHQYHQIGSVSGALDLATWESLLT